MSKRVLLIDGNNYLFRAAYAVQNSAKLKSASGFPTYGITGFFNILMADIVKLRPDNIVVAFDKGGAPNWRKQVYPAYKENRDAKKADPKVQEIYSQAKPLRALIKAAGFRVSARAGTEADDIIGSLAVQFSDTHKVIIASKDKDFAQLVTKNIVMLDPTTRKLITESGVVERFGVKPNQIVDYLALLGDSVDNIPGVNKCGAKTAAKWLAQCSTLKELQRNKDIMTPKLRANFEEVESHFKLTKKLLRITTDLELNTNLDNCKTPTSILDEIRFDELCDYYSLARTKRQLIQVMSTWQK